MKIIKQYNNYACVLACLESYLTEGKFEVMDPNINRDSVEEEYAIFNFSKELNRQPAFLAINRTA